MAITGQAPGGQMAGASWTNQTLAPSIEEGSGPTAISISQGGTGQSTDPLPPFMASDAGMLAWAFDPYALEGSYAIAVATVTLIRINIRVPMTITNVIISVGGTGSGLTSSENFVGLYAGQTGGGYTAGQLIGTSADQTSAWGTVGPKTAALIGGPYTVPTGFVWAAVLPNASSAAPSFARATTFNTSVANVGLSVSNTRWGTYTGGTTLPTSLTLSSISLFGYAVWAAVS